jgi:nucleotide-binding universal stress UspA family protein
MYHSIETILIPIDFSDQSMIAIEQSYNIAKCFNARITLLHVITSRLKIDESSDIVTDQLDDITDKLNKISNNITEESGIPCSFTIEKGRVVPAIIDVAKNISARFIIIGSQKLSIGAITMRIIKEAPCPVISIKGKFHRKGCKRIILPLDLTKTTTRKVRMTSELANFFNANVNVVSANSPSKDLKLTKLSMKIEQVRDYFVSNNVACTTKLLDVGTKIEHISNNLLDYSDDMEGDLIVIMIQQENQFKEKIIGSLARKIILGSNIPVLCLKPEFKINNENI